MTKRNLPPLTDAQEAQAQASIAADPDNPEWTEADFAAARPFAEVFPALAASIRRGRGPAKKPTKELITLRIDRATLDAFRATGDGWQTRISDALAKSAAKLRKT